MSGAHPAAGGAAGALRPGAFVSDGFATRPIMAGKVRGAGPSVELDDRSEAFNTGKIDLYRGKLMSSATPAGIVIVTANALSVRPPAPGKPSLSPKNAPGPSGTSKLGPRWWLFGAATFVLIGVMLANLRAEPVGDFGPAMRYAFWLATAAAAFCCWRIAQLLVVSRVRQLNRSVLIGSSLVATLLFAPCSLAIDALFALPETESDWLSLLRSEWFSSALPIAASCMIASLPAWWATAHFQPVSTESPPASPVVDHAPAAIVEDHQRIDEPPADLLPSAVRGGVLRATADLQYVHLFSQDGVTTVLGPLHRVITLLGDTGLEVRRGDWVADRHVRQLKPIRGRWTVMLKDGNQVAISRRRVAEVKKRWGSTRFN